MPRHLAQPDYSPEAGTGGRCPGPARCIGGEAHAGANIGIEEAAEFGRVWGPRGGNRFASALISLALDEVDATDAHRRLRGNADAGRTEAIVPMI